MPITQEASAATFSKEINATARTLEEAIAYLETKIPELPGTDNVQIQIQSCHIHDEETDECYDAFHIGIFAQMIEKVSSE